MAISRAKDSEICFHIFFICEQAQVFLQVPGSGGFPATCPDAETQQKLSVLEWFQSLESGSDGQVCLIMIDTTVGTVNI